MKSTKNSLTYMEGPGFSRGSDKFAHNQWSGHSNDGRLVNYPGQKRVGNDGSCGHSGYEFKGKKPEVNAAPAKKSNPDAQHYGAQTRTPGGTKEMPNRGKTSFDMGRGPTKGNQQ